MEAAGKGLKSFIVVVLVLGLVLGQQQIQAEAKICCPTNMARTVYNTCRFQGHGTQAVCAKVSGCKIVDGKCDYRHSSHSEDANALEFCKMGCASSACDNMKQAVGDEEASDAVHRCEEEACHRFYTKHVDPTAAATSVV